MPPKQQQRTSPVVWFEIPALDLDRASASTRPSLIRPETPDHGLGSWPLSLPSTRRRRLRHQKRPMKPVPAR